ncbi:MAG TPA: 4-(cytidine 5'-diphospho)-2-C-methyl-D-erythritol kinase [Pedomonas sp.]|uniref:4-(cytidine 5'-diphospho)-2-C-methyl-D-erythritol kinase n=1 Tax=Pedomonas sp. TaxID=2976421 RepID=UPI002F40D67D
MTAAILVEPAPAKLNLFLHVIGRREDGYHLLETLFVFTEAGDELTVSAADSLSLAIEGPYAGVLAGEQDNLILRAARALADAAGLQNAGARLVLQKNLPVAAGLGGGSADAAATLRALNQLWRLNRSLEQLAEIGAGLGADIPACVYSKPMWGHGIGTELIPTRLTEALPVILVNPGLPLATPDVFRTYAELGREFSAELPEQDSSLQPSLAWAAGLANDLETAARLCLPLLEDVRDALLEQEGVRLVRMAGSGPTWFAVFDNQAQASLAAERLRRCRPDWWVAETTVKCGQ